MAADIIKSRHSKGVFFVKDQEWKVGERYELLHLLGSGSFSSVCCALDTFTGQRVALKRIPDILSSPELARRVLREICILRRLRHPFIITLLDAFLTPSSTGQYKMVNGLLVPSSLDCYLSMELGEDGDLFNLRGQISGDEVRLLMWQMLHALKYLHALNVWHRDIKSSNILLSRGSEGHRIVKVADFGSSRSATTGGYHWAEQGAPEPRSGQLRMPVSRQVIQEQRAQHKRGEIPSDPMDIASGAGVEASDLFVQLGHDERQGEGVGFCSPLTRVVATPCYRAPEVVMSRGGYTSAVDMWSLGCILGELLQRAPRVGSASTPHLKVAPLFAIHAGLLKTPEMGERWCAGSAPGDVTTRGELQALFDVIGTPSWAEAEDVLAPEWRTYLQRLPGRAPTLFRRFAFAGEVAVHLLSRLLAFDPERRCTAEEALQHEYFVGLETDVPEMGAAGASAWGSSLAGEMEEVTLAGGPAPGGESGLPIKGLKTQVEAAWEYQAAKKSKLDTSHKMEAALETILSSSAGEAAAMVEEAVSQQQQQQQRQGQGRPEAGQQPRQEAESASPMSPSEWHHYYEDPDAARALALLETEIGGVDEPAAQINHLRQMLEKECESQAKQGKLRAQVRAKAVSEGGERRWASPPRTSLLAVWGDSNRKAASDTGDGLQVDQSQDPDASKFGQERLSNVADTWNAKLDTAEFLKPGRHGEWTMNSGLGPAAGPRWGVSMTPPGGQGGDPKMQDIIRSQQLR